MIAEVCKECRLDCKKHDPEIIRCSNFRPARKELDNLNQTERGIVIRLRERYGFIKAENGENIFFAKRAVLGDVFEKLRVGHEVKFNLVDYTDLESGEERIQATLIDFV